MVNDIRENHRKLKELLDNILATDSRGNAIATEEAFKNSIDMIFEHAKAGKKLIFIGNGGSASIASHLATDFLKNAKIPAMAFNDSSLLTCIGNDFGYRYVFEKPIEMFAELKDVLIAISSSGQSKNILLGVKRAKTKGAKVITLSGFDKGNPLRKMGEINFYVPSRTYGHVEIIHLSICHSFIDVIIKHRSKLTKNTRCHG